MKIIYSLNINNFYLVKRFLSEECIKDNPDLVAYKDMRKLLNINKT